MRLHCFILKEACSCTLELVYFAGQIAKNRLVCNNAVALAYYGSCRLPVMGSCCSICSPVFVISGVAVIVPVSSSKKRCNTDLLIQSTSDKNASNCGRPP